MTIDATNWQMPLIHSAWLHRRLRAPILLTVPVFTMFVLLETAVAVTKWHCALPQPIHDPYGAIIADFANHVTQTTNGKVTIDVSNCRVSLSTAHDLKSREANLELLSGAEFDAFAAQEPAFAMASLPFLATNYDQLRWFYGFWRPVVEELLSHKFHRTLLFMIPGPPQYLLTTVLVRKPDDLKKIMIGTASKKTTRLFSELGASTKMSPPSNLAQELKAGTINALTYPLASRLIYDIFGSSFYMYATNHSWSPSAITVDLSAWQSLSRDQQRAIQDLTNELEPQYWTRIEQYAAAESSKLVSRGVRAAPINEDLQQFFDRKTVHIRGEQVTRMPRTTSRIVGLLEDFRVPRKCPPYCKAYPPAFCKQNPQLCNK